MPMATKERLTNWHNNFVFLTISQYIVQNIVKIMYVFEVFAQIMAFLVQELPAF